MKPVSNNHIPLCGLVLAGGRSSRMGTDKASLRHADGRALAKRTHELLVEAGCESVMLSLRAGQDIPAGFPSESSALIIRDPQGESAGPLTGILAALRQQPAARWLAVACDLPRLDVATLRALISAHQRGEAFVAFRSEHDGLPEPLCALYAPEAVSLLESALAAEQRCPRKILITHNCRLLEPVSPGSLDNANTPEDWAATRRP